MQRLRWIGLGLLLALLPARFAGSDEMPWPEGQSTQELHGLKVILDLPKGIASMQAVSLVVILHGAGGTAEGMAGALRAWPADGYVVCAPKAKGQTWSPDDLVRVLRIAAELKRKLPIDARKVHVVGYSNGGWNLTPIAFDDDLKPCSATWVAAGFGGGGSPPKWAVKEMGAIALAGAQDANLRAARDTVRQLHEKVRSVEVRVQPNLGHQWTDALMPYLRWWMGAMEGRFEPGVDMNFEWGDSVDAAVKALENQKKGGVFVYVFDTEADKTNEHAKRLQNEVFMDLAVRHYGNQLRAVKLERAAAAEWLTALKVKLKATPAVVVLKRDGKLKKVLQGKIKASKLASALRGVAPNRKRPLD
ncbi:MAG: hypothetical protein QNJ98_08110 [Planctomycetota bacterium]|nr:hypothetical protein [Planctomycetota bacterium]